MMDALSYYRAELKKSKPAIDYLKGRGLSGEIAARYGLGYAPDGWQNLESVFTDYATAALKDTGLVIDAEPDESHPERKARRYDRFRDRVMFPILDARGNVIGFGGRIIGAGEPKYLNSPETPLFEKGRELYGLYQARRAIRDANQVIVVEGYMDVVALAQHGVDNAVATLGTATTPVHVAKLLKLADNVVFCFDGDAAGRKAAWRALEVSLPVLADGKVVSFLFLPPEDDPDTYVRREGKAAFLAAVADAKPLSQFLFARARRPRGHGLGGGTRALPRRGKAAARADRRPRALGDAAPAPGRARQARTRGDRSARSGPGPRASRGAEGCARRPAPCDQPAERQLLALLLARPELVANVSDEVLDGAGTDAHALRAVVDFFRQGPNRNLGQASAYFEGSEHHPAMVEALREPLLKQAESPDFDYGAEADGLVQRMAEERRARRATELLRLVEAGEATAEQRAEFQAHHARLAAAKSGNQAPEGRSKL